MTIGKSKGQTNVCNIDLAPDRTISSSN